MREQDDGIFWHRWQTKAKSRPLSALIARCRHPNANFLPVTLCAPVTDYTETTQAPWTRMVVLDTNILVASR